MFEYHDWQSQIFFLGEAMSLCRPGQLDACHEAIIAALLRYDKPADQPELTIRLPVTSKCRVHGTEVESIQPRDANHLLFIYACELVTGCEESEMCSFVNRLVRTLIRRGFDLDTRDAHGNSLLSLAAIAALLTPKAESAFGMLVDLGADRIAGAALRATPFCTCAATTSSPSCGG